MSNVQDEIRDVVVSLDKMYDNPGALKLGDPYCELVAVILSARARDEQVLDAMQTFFKRFPTVRDLAKAGREEIEAEIDSIGLFRQKAKYLQSMAQDVVDKHDGEIPETMDELVDLAGVGRKTASVVLVSSFNHPAIAVDTHVHRVANRLGWVDTDRPKQTEKALLEIVPKELWSTINRVFVKFGRYVCDSQSPRCWMCPFQEYCEYEPKNAEPPDDAGDVRQSLKDREAALESRRRQVKDICENGV
jgi:endonuclease-3